MIRALPDLGSCAAISRGMDNTAAPLSSVVNSSAFMQKVYAAQPGRSNSIRPAARYRPDAASAARRGATPRNQRPRGLTARRRNQQQGAKLQSNLCGPSHAALINARTDRCGRPRASESVTDVARPHSVLLGRSRVTLSSLWSYAGIRQVLPGSQSRRRPENPPTRPTVRGMSFVNGAPWNTQDAVAERTEAVSP